MIVTVHFIWRPDRQRSDSIGKPFYKRSPEKQLIAEYDMTYVSQLGFPTTVPPRQSHLIFVANHSTTLTTTHFRYLLLDWLLVAVFAPDSRHRVLFPWRTTGIRFRVSNPVLLLNFLM